MNDKLNYMVKEIRMTGSTGCVGKNDTNVQMLLYESDSANINVQLRNSNKYVK